jgi:hypothetical protein
MRLVLLHSKPWELRVNAGATSTLRCSAPYPTIQVSLGVCSSILLLMCHTCGTFIMEATHPQLIRRPWIQRPSRVVWHVHHGLVKTFINSEPAIVSESSFFALKTLNQHIK